MTEDTFKVETRLLVLQCCTCHISFAIPSSFMNARRKDHATFHCPSGHANYYPHKSDIEIAKEAAAEARKEVDRLKNCVEHKTAIIKMKDYQVRHWKGRITKINKSRSML